MAELLDDLVLTEIRDTASPHCPLYTPPRTEAPPRRPAPRVVGKRDEAAPAASAPIEFDSSQPFEGDIRPAGRTVADAAAPKRTWLGLSTAQDLGVAPERLETYSGTLQKNGQSSGRAHQARLRPVRPARRKARSGRRDAALIAHLRAYIADKLERI